MKPWHRGLIVGGEDRSVFHHPNARQEPTIKEAKLVQIDLVARGGDDMIGLQYLFRPAARGHAKMHFAADDLGGFQATAQKQWKLTNNPTSH